ncbi:ABC transporter permease [Paenibacillus sp. N1-5-1-14]|uniref:ABC transporter permease n=1 Tax=Paenibacillus radicibacter TaxID=2972488 RepID=UPI0021599DC8|nr:ABC transporter permease [Paenibacillus radicibacter]MCR8643426.1 ABC transporter permease [Paenibacillus radicibacter]
MSTFSMKRVSAILVKDYKDISRNMFVFSTLFMPLIMAAIYGRSGMMTIESHYMVLSMGFVLVGTYFQSALIAEEKEKNTLRGLMLSPATTLEIFFGKSLLSFIATALVVAGSMYLTEYHPGNVLVVAIALIASSIFYIGLGSLIGLITKSVMEASVAVLPAVVLFSFGSFITFLAEANPSLSFLLYLPNLQLIELAQKVENGTGLMGVISNIGVILVWAIVIHLIAAYVFKKRMRDE